MPGPAVGHAVKPPTCGCCVPPGRPPQAYLCRPGPYRGSPAFFSARNGPPNGGPIACPAAHTRRRVGHRWPNTTAIGGAFWSTCRTSRPGGSRGSTSHRAPQMPQKASEASEGLRTPPGALPWPLESLDGDGAVSAPKHRPRGLFSPRAGRRFFPTVRAIGENSPSPYKE